MTKKKIPGPKARKIIARDHKILSPSYIPRPYPFVMESGKGCVVKDVDGNSFLDFTSGIAVCSTGHAHPQVVKAIQKQAAKFLHMCGADFYYESQVALAEKLSEATPGKFKKRVIFTNSGAETIEAAIKLSRYSTGRKKILAFYGGFHGRTMGALSLTNSKAVQREHFGPFVPGIYHAPYGDLDFIENKLFKKLCPPKELAAVVVEPIQGEGGYLFPPKGFLRALKKMAEKHRFLYVSDEIQAGMGRTGKFLAVEHEGVLPDIVCLAKGIASGLPLGALISSEKIMRWKPGSHGSTFGGNPLACVAALETLKLIRTKLMNNARLRGAELMAELNQIKIQSKNILEIRGRGLMVAAEIGQNQKLIPAKRDQIVEACFQNGLLLLPCGESAIRFTPPLTVSKNEIRRAAGIFKKVCLKD